MASEVSVCSQALVMLGALSISSFEENNGPTCDELFSQVKENVLLSHPWRFNTIKGEQLARAVEEPTTQYNFEYILPPDSLVSLPRTVWNSSFNSGRGTPYTDFNIFKKRLLTNAEQIFIDYQINVEADDFPPHVTELLIRAMAARLARPVTGDESIVRATYAEAWGSTTEKGKGGESRVARRIDDQGHPSQAIKNYPLTAVRHGGF